MLKLVAKIMIISSISLVGTVSSDAGIKTKLALVTGGLVAKGLVQGCLKSPQCKVTGAKKAGEVGVAIIHKYGPEAVKKCMANSACMNTIFAAMAAGSAVIPHLSEKNDVPTGGNTSNSETKATESELKAPGNCTPDTYTKLNNNVAKFCGKGVAEERRCLQSDAIEVLEMKMNLAMMCMQARAKREEKCFNGGNAGHREQIEAVRKSMDKCQTIRWSKQFGKN